MTKILVVGADKNQLELLRLCLDGHYEVSTLLASDVDSVIHFASEQSPDAIVYGFPTIPDIRRLHSFEDISHIPILVFGSVSLALQRREVLELVDGFIPGPFTRDQLLSALEVIL